MRLRDKADAYLAATRHGTQRLVTDTRAERRKKSLQARRELKKLRRTGVFVGHDATGWPLYSASQGGILLLGGGRSGKGKNILTTQLNSGYAGDIVLIDPKEAENTYQLNKLVKRHIVVFMTQEMPGLGVSASTNIWSHLKPGENLVAWARIAAADFLGYTGDKHAQYFEVGGRERFLTPVLVHLADKEGEVSVPRTAHLFLEFQSNSQEWASVEYDMHFSQYPFVRAMAAKFRKFRTEGIGRGGEEGMLGEVLNAFVSLNDPRNSKMLSPPYSFDMSVLGKEPGPDDWPYTVVMAKPTLEIKNGDAALVRGFISRVMHEKRTNPLARETLCVCEEAGHLAPFEGMVSGFTEAAGFNWRQEVLLQEISQGDDLAPNGHSKMANSAAAHIVMGIRDIDVGDHYSKRLGEAQVEFQDLGKIARARLERKEAQQRAWRGEVDAFNAVREMRVAEAQVEVESRPLRYPAELINMERDRGFIWMDEIVGAIDAKFRPFWDVLKPGDYLDNPQFWRTNGKDRVIVKRRLGGTTTREVEAVPVPEEFQDCFHFKNGRMPARRVKK